MADNETRFCQYCGKQISADVIFCPFCGKKQLIMTTAQQDIQPTATIAVDTNKPTETSSKTESSNESSTFSGALKRYFAHLFNLDGRSGLGDYWWPQLLLFIVNLVVMTILTLVFFLPVFIHPDDFFYYDDDFTTALTVRIIGFIAIVCLIQLVEFFLNFSVTVRRLHDSGKSGLFLLLYLLFIIPYIGGLAASITLLVFSLLPGDPSPNRFGQPTRTTHINQ
ncbi:DUF805 domain-containing protein [Paucilactobacillus sp. N302-9]